MINFRSRNDCLTQAETERTSTMYKTELVNTETGYCPRIFIAGPIKLV